MIKAFQISELEKNWDCIIVGGGIVGAGLFRDLSLQGKKCLLIDAKDFSSQTSSKSSKMLHGGIRYLENFDFDLVREALAEKNHWIKTAPHLCYEEKFFLPVYQDSLRPTWMMKIGFALYDFLSEFKNKPHSWLSAKQATQQLPLLKSDGLKSVGIYHDAVMNDRALTLEVILDALESGQSKAINHMSFVNAQESDLGMKVTLKDELSGQTTELSCADLAFCLGPFTDQVLGELSFLNWQKKLIPSQGSHLWLKRSAFNLSYPTVLPFADGRVVFVIPQFDRVLVGTTEIAPKGSLFDVDATNMEIEYIKQGLATYFPHYQMKEDDIIGTFAGIRPLVSEGNETNRGKTARNHVCFQPHERVHAIMGGKYTTFRVMAAELAEQICRRSGHMYQSSLSLNPLRKKLTVNSFDDSTVDAQMIEQIIDKELIRTKSDLTDGRLELSHRTNLTMSDCALKLIEKL
jgi:glycerol-3-phosphate dehydrogenase